MVYVNVVYSFITARSFRYMYCMYSFSVVNWSSMRNHSDNE